MELTYTVTRYPSGGGTAILAKENGEPYCDCSVNLIDYGIRPSKSQIIVPVHKMSKELAEKIISDLAKEVVCEITFGPFNSKGVLIKLKDEYQNN